MAPGQTKFTYSAEDLQVVRTFLSPERLAMYMKAVMFAKDLVERTRKGLKRYEYNTSLAEAFYPVIQGFEVSLRNAVHNRLSTDHGAEWLDTFALLESEKNAIAEARATIARKPQEVTTDRIVAELTFGFWVRLFSAEYAESLWGPSLSKVVTVKDRRALYDRFIEVKTLRNRIAHHNRIIGRTPDVEETYNRVLEALDWISPTVCSWVIGTSSLPERLKKRAAIAQPAKAQTAPETR